MQFVFISQEAFRYVIYKVLRATENGLQEVSDSSRIVENKHILAYVCGLGFGLMSGLFSLVNPLADAVSYLFNIFMDATSNNLIFHKIFL